MPRFAADKPLEKSKQSSEFEDWPDYWPDEQSDEWLGDMSRMWYKQPTRKLQK